jgi:amino acid adenylation domain-containing protein
MTLDSKDTIPESPSRNVIELISDQARRNPDATAVVCGDRRLSYRQLDTLSSRAARYIRGLGVREQTPVAVCLPRGVDAIVTLLAVIKAGAIFVPLDPGHPPQRLAYTIENARAPVLLTDRPELWFEQAPGTKVVTISPLPESDQSGDVPLPAIRDTDLAYVIYTSGSTGQPKGVMIEHAALACHIKAMVHLYELGPGERVLHHSSLAFDASLEAIFSGLAAGAELVIAPGLLGPAELIDLIGRHGVTMVELTPAYWAQVVDVLPSHRPSALESLRLLILGGDVIPAGTLVKFIAMRPGIKVLNTYGPTEATIACTAFAVPSDWHGTTVSIGWPTVPEKPVYILDESLNSVPIGEVGEICVGGPVARGYLHDQVLTAERFVTRQPAEGPRERIYRTGDLGRKQANGSIEFIGRMDRQVRVRGTRVEPAEIEGVLSRHPAVLGAAVVPVGDVTERRLVAYIEWANGARESIDDLRGFAREHLTSAMLPASWVSVDSIPTTVAGKVDLPALLRLEPAEPVDEQAASEETAASELEEAVAGIWRDVLSVPTVSLHDNFFDLGGHSLSAMVLVFRLTDRFSVEIPLTAAFTHPTPYDMAEFIEQSLADEEGSGGDEEASGS